MTLALKRLREVAAFSKCIVGTEGKMLLLRLLLHEIISFISIHSLSFNFKAR